MEKKTKGKKSNAREKTAAKDDDWEQIEEAELLEAAEEPKAVAEAAPEAAVPEIRPLVVCDENGGFLFLASTNRKGYAKSIEQGALWLAHPDTDRILPSGKEARLKQIQDRGDYYYAEVLVEEGASAAKAAASEEEPSAGAPPQGILAELTALIARRREDKTEGSYTSYLFQEGAEKIRKKTGEEAIELILARTPQDIVYEAADLVYHMLVLLEAEGIALADVLEELKSRR
jgi:phosphoribosyl-ATP pyrophosphohydrolase